MALWVIGDIHGQVALLTQLFELLPRQAGDLTVFLGDYIDRGPDSAGVVARVLTELDDGAVALWGNHEDMAAAAYGLESPGKPSRELATEIWLYPANGGPDTLRSFGASLSEVCPEPLRLLFARLKPYWIDPVRGIELVHAFAPARRSLDELAAEKPEMTVTLKGPALLLWANPRPREAADPGREVVVGHTSLVSATPERRGHHLLIDTNAARGGPLTALRIEGSEREAWQVFPSGASRRLREQSDGTWVAVPTKESESSVGK